MARLPLRPLVGLLSFFLLLTVFHLYNGSNRNADTTLASYRPASTPWSSSWSPSRLKASHHDLGLGLKSAQQQQSPHLPPRPSAAFVILCRNSDLGELLPTLTSLESTFNAHPQASYPYIFLNDVPFSEYFKSKLYAYLAGHRARIGGPDAVLPDLRFGTIPKEHWEPPGWLDWVKVHLRWADMIRAKIPYANNKSYRQMCRWQSGFFWKHPLLRDIEFYWRVEPSTRFTCNIVPAQGASPSSWDINADGRGDFFDPFRYMKANGKKYGWVLSLREYQATIKTLWPKARKWMLEHPEYHAAPPDGRGGGGEGRTARSAKGGSMLDFILKEDKIGYNRCHFWSNFEIASLDFYRSEGYQAFFDFLDSPEGGGFFYERWGDAPIHSIAAAWLLRKDEVHNFLNIGYYHTPFNACPRGEQYKARCACDAHTNFDYHMSSFGCQKEWDAVQGINSTEKILHINEEMGYPNWREFAILDVPN